MVASNTVLSPEAPKAPKPPTPREWLAEHHRNYDGPLQRALAAEIMTATTAWQLNYAAQQAASGAKVKACLSELTRGVERIESLGLSEDTEKSLKDAIKDLSKERESAEAFMSRAVMPFIRCVDECRTIRERATAKAREMARETPLLSDSINFAKDVAELIEAWPQPEWDGAAGVLTVKNK